MLCRQVIPNKKNGIVQIYIVKSENEPETEGMAGSSMDPEDVEVKQEPPSDDEQQDSAANLHFNMMDVIIKGKPDELGESSKAFPVASTSTKRVKKEPVKQEIKGGGECDSANDAGTEDFGSDWSERNKIKSDDDPTSNNGDVIDSEPIPRKVVKKKKINNKRKTPEDPPIRQNVIKRFVCLYCHKKFSSPSVRQRHEKKHATNLPPEERLQRKQHYCYICKKEHDSKDKLHEHLCVHADMIPYLCPECENPIKLSSVRLLNKHIQLHQQVETGIIKCKFCPERFHSFSGCEKHEKRHVEKDKLVEAEASAEIESKRLNVKVLIVDGLKRYECEYCKKSYTLLTTLRRHVNSHTNETAYVCKTCGKVFNNYASLIMHEKKTHTDLTPYKCETCGKGFKDSTTLILHRHIHTGDKPFSCHCGLSFIKKGGLTTHQGKCDIPENLGSCACRFCQILFPSYLEMIRHIQEVHAPDMEETMCRLCPVKFKDAAQLATHEIRHELPGVIKCNQCTRIFKNQFHLNLHMPAHESSYVCNVCGKTFLHNVNLRVHRRVHSDKRPHVCDLCSTTFNCRTTLRKHRLTHYNLTSRNYIPGLVDDTVVEIEDDKKENEEYEEVETLDVEDEEEKDVGLDLSKGSEDNGR